MIGQTISHYKILEKLGEGGMGVVYKAEDTKLDRFVALKFLPPHLNASEQDKSRFVQEAKAAAALNHPNVCSIIDIQEHGGQLFIVMEFVDGQTLQARKSSLSWKQAIDIGIQIADGLAAAHEKGIVHRDIKPENIMIRKDGIAQIMDFGLAKLRASRATRLTREGSTVGTAGYMSPEQVQGQETDHRSDIFSLGVVLYEIFAGRLPFQGAHETAILYEIVNVDPTPPSIVRPELDPELDRIVLECLQKEPDERYNSVKDIAKDLKRFKRESSRQRVSRATVARDVYKPSTDQSAKAPESKKVPMSIWVAGTILFFAISIVLAILQFRQTAVQQQIVQSYILPPEKSIFANISGGQAGGQIALSPDGTMLACVVIDSTGMSRILIRNLRSLSFQTLSGTQGAYYPFWSPDNRNVGFFAGGFMKRIEASGGPAMSICQVTAGRGGAWNKDGVVLFSPQAGDVIYKVPASGGVPVAITRFDSTRRERTHRWPQFLPDGKHFLYFARTTTQGTGGEEDAIRVGSLDDGTTNISLVHAHSNMVYANGALFFLREQTLYAQEFDAKNLELKGEAFPVAEQIQFDASFSRGVFTVSETGTLAYEGGGTRAGWQLFWIDRSTHRRDSLAYIAEYLGAKFSPDEKKMIVDIYDPPSRNRDLWIFDLVRGVRTRYTFDPAADRTGVWSNDGNRVIFSSDRKGHFDLYLNSLTGPGNEEVLLQSNLDKFASDCSPDGKYIIFDMFSPASTKTDIYILPLTGERKPVVFLQTEANEAGGHFSPDMKWIVYESDESGQAGVYVRPFKGSGEKWQISTSGGASPRWRRDGKEILYVTDQGKIMAVDVTEVGSTLQYNTPHLVMDLQSRGETQIIDISGDGQKFLVRALTGGQSSAPVVLVLNPLAELTKK